MIFIFIDLLVQKIILFDLFDFLDGENEWRAHFRLCIFQTELELINCFVSPLC